MHRSRYVQIGPHEIHFTEWGDPSAPALVLWHGLARLGRDFDELAAGLADRWHVICPDTIGRGLSSWAADPGAEYNFDSYASLALGLLDALGIARAAWLGTSMGGLIGMWLASGPGRDRLSALIVNDIGPELPQAAIDRITTYVGTPPDFATVTEGEAWLRKVYAPFGPASDAFWQRMAESSLRRRADGRLTLHYDPAITRQFTDHPGDFATWERYATITTPMHLIWGTQSDLLTTGIVERMQAEGPRPGLTAYEDCGHAPTLSGAAAIAHIGAVLAELAGQGG